MENEKIINLLEFLQKNYLIIDGYYYSNKAEPIKNYNGGNQITHSAILEEYEKSKLK